MFAWVFAAALALSAPSHAVVADVGVSETPQAERTPEAIMALPPALQARLHDSVLAGHPSPMQRLERLVQFMFDADKGLGLTYQADATVSVAQVVAGGEANCLSFTLAFLALAREAGLDAYPQEIGETLSWREVDGTVYRSNHVNAGVRIAGHRYTVDVAADWVIARHAPVRVSDERLLAHYYNNLAMDDLQKGQMGTALQDIATALAIDPGYAPHWSNAGVLQLHAGDIAAAERDYAQALELDPLDASALSNMIWLMHRKGDSQHEAVLRQRLARVQLADPLQQFLQARADEQAGDVQSAIEHYRRAIRLQPDEHRYHEALARAYLQIGDIRRAGKAQARARHLSERENLSRTTD